MCGLFGAVWTGGQPTPLEQTRRAVALTVLATIMEGRGNQSWGVFAPGANGGTLDKGTGSIDNVSMIPYARARMLIGHTRFATQGAITRDNAHPFRFGRIVGAHNGVIYNAGALDRSRGQRFAVDSMHLIHALNAGDRFDDFDGYGTVIWHDERDARVLQVGRFNAGDFSAAVTDGGVIFASTQSAVKQAATAAGLKVLRLVALDERHRYRITDAEIILAERDRFTCGRTSTRSWRDGFGDTWRNQLDGWSEEETAAGWRRWTPPATRPAVSTTTTTATVTRAAPPAPAERPASVLFDDPEEEGFDYDETDGDRAVFESLAIKHGLNRNDARRVWDEDFDPMNEADELYHFSGLFDEDLFYDVQDVADHDAWAQYMMDVGGGDLSPDDVTDNGDDPTIHYTRGGNAVSCGGSVFGAIGKRVRV